MTATFTQQPCIKIKPIAKHNGIFLCVSGALLLIAVLIFAQYYWQPYKFALIFMVLLSLILLLIGIVKLFEPSVSLYLTPSHIRFNHRYGSWQLSWKDIKNINLISEAVGTQREQLPYVGIQLVHIDKIAKNISVRLANRLIHQQKGLIVYSVLHQLMTIEQSQLNFQPFTLTTGEIISGPIAAFLHQTEQLSSALGYHLFLPADSFDRSTAEFTQLLKQCQQVSNTDQK